MKCRECGGAMTTEKNAVRRYTLGGLPHVELHGVEANRCPTCGNETVAIPRIAQLHRIIAQGFATQSRMLAPVEIRFLRKHVGLSGVDFAKQWA
jgi:putative transcriptional regulator